MRRFVEGMVEGRARCFLNAWKIGSMRTTRFGHDVFVDELDLSALGFGGVNPEITGRPSYHPSVLLKLYIYGYLNRVQSRPAAGARGRAQR